jgi:hypothetical protein
LAPSVGSTGPGVSAGPLARRRGQGPREHVRRQAAVGVGEQDPRADGGRRPGVTRVALAEPAIGQGRHLDDAGPRIGGAESPHHVRGAVGRPIADDDHLECDVLLREERADGVGDALRFVARRDHHRHVDRCGPGRVRRCVEGRQPPHPPLMPERRRRHRGEDQRRRDEGGGPSPRSRRDGHGGVPKY